LAIISGLRFAPQRGNPIPAQGNALGKLAAKNQALKGRNTMGSCPALSGLGCGCGRL